LILIDSNIPMYLVGGSHPKREAARQLLEEAIAANEPMCTDAEVLREILHRYVALRRYEEIDHAFDVLTATVDVIYPIEAADVERARRIVHGPTKLSARDAVHVAVMQARDVDRVMSFDRAFDLVPGIKRIGHRPTAVTR
jgi:predicted nucleic acid-binding protein